MFPLDTHNIYLAMQEVRLGVPLSEIEAWEKMKQKTPDLSQPQPSLPEYFGKAQENTSLYCEAFTSLHPEVDDPMSQETDEVALMLAGGGLPHGRPACLSGGVQATEDLHADQGYPPRRQLLYRASSTASSRCKFSSFSSSFGHSFLNG
jgi:hypothetical protein